MDQIELEAEVGHSINLLPDLDERTRVKLMGIVSAQGELNRGLARLVWKLVVWHAFPNGPHTNIYDMYDVFSGLERSRREFAAAFLFAYLPMRFAALGRGLRTPALPYPWASVTEKRQEIRFELMRLRGLLECVLITPKNV